MSAKAGWTRVAFGDVVRLVRERTSNPEDDGFERYVGLEHIDPSDLRIRRWGNVSDGTTFSNVFRAGQVLFGKRRAYQRKVAVADFDGVCSGDIYVFEPKGDGLLPELLPFICQTDRFFEYAVGTSAGSLSPRTNWHSLAAFEFPLPPLDEQRRVAHLVTHLDSAVNSETECTVACEQLIASARLERFDPNTYKPVPLASLCDDGVGIQIGPFGAQLHQSDYREQGVPVVMPSNMNSDRIDPDGIACVSHEKAEAMAVHRLQPGDILLPRRGELDRRALTTIHQAGWLCGTGSIRIRLADGLSPLAVLHALASRHCVEWLESNAVGTTMLNLNSRIVGMIPIALPRGTELEETLHLLGDLQAQFQSCHVRLSQLIELRQRALSHATGH